MPRIFIAIPIPDNIKTRLLELSSLGISSFRWVAKENLHLTLAFLGEITDTQLQAIPSAVQEASKSIKEPLVLQLVSIGAFPSEKSPKVLWVGVAGALRELNSLQACLVKALNERRFIIEQRRFIPHITIARSKGSSSWPTQLDGNREQVFGSWIANEIHVIESQLNPSGPVYTVQYIFTLGKNES